jgi:hypothetical protein
MEPVSSSFGGAFAPLLTFSSANMLNTTITATTMLSRIWRRELSQRAATGFRIIRAKRIWRPADGQRRGNFTSSRLTNY